MRDIMNSACSSGDCGAQTASRRRVDGRARNNQQQQLYLQRRGERPREEGGHQRVPFLHQRPVHLSNAIVMLSIYPTGGRRGVGVAAAAANHRTVLP
ncbi:unnamed protein product, partial [Iphiclides podalirius]